MLEGDAVEQAEKHNGRDIVSCQRGKRVAGDQDLEQARALPRRAISDPACRKSLRDTLRKHDQQSEGDYPQGNVEPPAGEEELPRLAWRHASKSVEQ